MFVLLSCPNIPHYQSSIPCVLADDKSSICTYVIIHGSKFPYVSCLVSPNPDNNTRMSTIIDTIQDYKENK